MPCSPRRASGSWSARRRHPRANAICERIIGTLRRELFDRAAARDFADMIATLDRFTDSEIPVPDGSSVPELRAFYAAWRSELTA
jgi:transposase InsO family protein